ncbi:MAG: DUF349 domain-containing protein [Pseudomonadales bacterium]|nr:DUF349 domain-containing protein [Pseudomonadales bacterium]
MKIARFLESTPKWQHKDPKVRAKAITAGLPLEQLLLIVSDDEDDSVKLLAISNIDDRIALEKLHRSTETGKQPEQLAVINRWVQLAEKEPADTLKTIINSETDTLLLNGIIKQAESIELRESAVLWLSTENQLLEILNAPNHSKIHQAAAQKLCDEFPESMQLESLQQQFLDKDKNVVRIIKSTREALKLKRQQQDEVRAVLDKNLQTIIKLSTSEYSNEFPRRFEVIRQGFIDITISNPELVSEAHKQEFEKHAAIVAAEIQSRAEKQAADTVQKKQVLSDLTAIKTQLAIAPVLLPTLAKVLIDTRSAWPDKDDLETYYQTTSSLEKLNGEYQAWQQLLNNLQNLPSAKALDALEKINWSDAYAKPTEIEDMIGKLKVQIVQLEKDSARHKQELDSLTESLTLFESVLEEGNLQRARKLNATLEKKVAKVDTSKDISTRFHDATAKFQALKDWQVFATLPKREELCESMLGLSLNLDIAPIEKAKMIKELQEEWKKLGPTDSRKAQKLWSTFKGHGDTAYAPCAQFYEDQKKLRQENLTKLRTLCDELKQFHEDTDWASVDWKQTKQKVLTARQSWRDLNNLPRAQWKRSQNQFNEALALLETKIQIEEQTNKASKIELIDLIEHSLASDQELNQIIEATKKAQSQWKTIGITDRKADQKLWKKFRKACDTVFSKRDEASVVQKQEANEVIQVGRKLCDDFNLLLESDTIIDKSHINNFKKEFESLKTSAQGNALRQQSQKLQKRAYQIIKEQVSMSHRQMLNEMRRLADLCQALESGKISTDELTTQWSTNETALDAPLLLAMEQRRDGNASISEQDAETLCIQLEILAGLDSPPESAQARMAYQVQRLKRELAEGNKETRSTQEQLDDLMVAWLSAPVSNPDLLSRFSRAELKVGYS